MVVESSGTRRCERKGCINTFQVARSKRFCSRNCKSRASRERNYRRIARKAPRRRGLSFEPVVKRCAIRGCRAIFLPDAVGAAGADAVLCFSHRRSAGSLFVPSLEEAKSEPVAPGTINLDANLSFAWPGAQRLGSYREQDLGDYPRQDFELGRTRNVLKEACEAWHGVPCEHRLGATA